MGELYNNDTELIDPHDKVSQFIGRSSIRIVPRIINANHPDSIKSDSDSPDLFIEPDERFINDVFMYIQQIDNALREPVFSGKSADTLQIFQDFIEPLNKSLLNIFGGDETTTIQIAEHQNATPYSIGKLIFRKGASKINYDLPSHGEKQVVILLLNFIVRKEYYRDAIIFIDEMDCHLNTALQSTLLEEIVNVWIPDNAQLWTASHALGFIDYARKAADAAIIDLDLLDFDMPQAIYPQPKESMEVYDIAIPKSILFNLLKDKKIIVCENKNDEYYNLLQIENAIFVGVKDARDVFMHIKRDNRYHSVRDRDFLSDAEIGRIKKAYPNHHILEYYDFENYLYHPDNIAEIDPPGFEKEQYMAAIRDQKAEKYDYILPAIISSRQTYEEFKTDERLRDKDVNSIVDDFKSDDFERFYKFFDMKTQFNKATITAFNLSKEVLVKTTWFKRQIEVVLTR